MGRWSGAWRWALGLLVLGCGGGHVATEPVVDGADAGAELVPSKPRATPSTRCGPTAGGPHWVLEGERLRVQVACGTGLTEPTPRFLVERLPPGATWDAASATLTWTPGTDQAAVWRLPLRELTSGETGEAVVGVVENADAPGNVRLADPTRYPEEYGLPVMHLAYDPARDLESDVYRPVELVYRGRRYTVQAKYRGASSKAFPKRSLTLKFPDDQPFTEPVFGDAFVDRKHLALVSTFNDNSYVRARLAFELWHAMDPGHLRVHTFSAVLYVNGRYHGLYTVADLPHGRLLRDNGLPRDTHLYKAVTSGANLSQTRPDGTPKPDPCLGLEKKEGTPEQGQPGWCDPWAELVRFVDGAPEATFRAERAQHLDVRDYEDWWIFVTLLLNSDATAKNAYHAYVPGAPGPWRYFPWDQDATFGQSYDTTRRGATVRLTYADANRVFGRMLADPAIAVPLRERYRTLLRERLSLDTVLARYDALVAETRASAQRDWKKWGAAYRGFGAPGSAAAEYFSGWGRRHDFTDYEGEVAYVRRWLCERWEALERQVP